MNNGNAGLGRIGEYLLEQMEVEAENDRKDVAYDSMLYVIRNTLETRFKSGKRYKEVHLVETTEGNVLHGLVRIIRSQSTPSTAIIMEVIQK